MYPKIGRRLAAVSTLAAAAALLSGCGLQPATSYVPPVGAGSIEPIRGLGDAQLTVGASNFTEQLILGKIAVLAATAAGFDVTDLSNIPGSQPARELIVAGQVDMLWEYTGTAWLTHLGQTSVIPDKGEMWKAVHDLDLKNGLTWGKPAPMNNTYAMAIRSEAAKKLGGISTVSQIAALPVEERTFCLEPEFNSRADGFDPMLKHYGMKRGTADGVPKDNVGLYDTGAVYSATDKGECNFGEVFTTDGRIVSLDLTVLEDDKKFFPAYNVAPVFFSKTLEEYPQLEGIFAEISPALTDKALRKMNGKVDVSGEEPADVAFEFMKDEGFISDPG